jgi:hypothetical protein
VALNHLFPVLVFPELLCWFTCFLNILKPKLHAAWRRRMTPMFRPQRSYWGDRKLFPHIERKAPRLITMNASPPLTFSHTAEYAYIESALKARWESFSNLATEFSSFVPREIADYSDERAAELARLKRLNPNSTDTGLLEFVDQQITARASLAMQFHFKFGDRVMSEYVTVAFLSHALCEALINAILAIGLSAANAPELFEMLERADIKDKWCIGPKALHTSYSLPKGISLYQTLQYLTRQRNALIHYKIDLEMQGKSVLRGSRLEHGSLKEQIAWIRRFFSLPYDLEAHMRKEIPQLPIMLLIDSRPIQRASVHHQA